MRCRRRKSPTYGTGQLVDWVSNQGIAGVDVELTNHQDSDFEINLAILSVFLDWSYPEK